METEATRESIKKTFETFFPGSVYMTMSVSLERYLSLRSVVARLERGFGNNNRRNKEASR